MKQRSNIGYGNDWATPSAFFDALNQEFHFDHDPCPLCADFDGLAAPWGWFNFCNPPYDKDGKTAFVRCAIAERERGKVTVLLLPVSTSTELFRDLFAVADEIRFVHKRLKFNGGKGTGMHDSMVVVLRPESIRQKVSLINHEGKEL
jgi:site-specific DNA-methyltransferase (adenine-specific)